MENTYLQQYFPRYVNFYVNICLNLRKASYLYVAPYNKVSIEQKTYTKQNQSRSGPFWRTREKHKNGNERAPELASLFVVRQPRKEWSE